VSETVTSASVRNVRGLEELLF